jgi:23S rRNA pseudouridine2605 synthase
MRLNRYISLSGVTSRRKADELISSGQVTINGKIVQKLGTDINPSLDRIAIDGKELHGPGKARY